VEDEERRIDHFSGGFQRLDEDLKGFVTGVVRGMAAIRQHQGRPEPQGGADCKRKRRMKLSGSKIL